MTPKYNASDISRAFIYIGTKVSKTLSFSSCGQIEPNGGVHGIGRTIYIYGNDIHISEGQFEND